MTTDSLTPAELPSAPPLQKITPELLEQLPVAAALYGPDGKVLHYNRRTAEIWKGCPPFASARDTPQCRQLFNLAGEPLPSGQTPMAEALRSGQRVRDLPLCFDEPGGTRRCLLVSIEVLQDRFSCITGLVVIFQNLSHSGEEERRKLLTMELSHRNKNILATVQAIADLTLRSARSLEDFRNTFEGRLAALSRAHDLLNEAQGPGASLLRVLAEQIAPYQSDDRRRIELLGEDRRLEPHAALVLSMAVHELAVNAAKYGALSRPEGRVSVAWRCGHLPEAKTPTLVLQWIERGGPPVSPPFRRGLGLRMLERGFTQELKGRAQIDFQTEGLACRMEIPIRREPPLQ